MSRRADPRRGLWVIDPSLDDPETECVREVLRGWRGESRVFRPGLDAADGPAPETGYDTAGVVLLGSRASVRDPYPWIARLAQWLGPLLDGSRPTPLLGICFGHQLIAQLAGGRVDFVDVRQAKRLGVEVTRLDGGRLLPGTHDLRVAVSNCEEVKDTPAGYRVTARRAGAAIDGLEHPELPVFSFQFHPEARREFALGVGFDPGLIDARLVRDGRRLLAAFRARVRTP